MNQTETNAITEGKKTPTPEQLQSCIDKMAAQYGKTFQGLAAGQDFDEEAFFADSDEKSEK